MCGQGRPSGGRAPLADGIPDAGGKDAPEDATRGRRVIVQQPKRTDLPLYLLRGNMQWNTLFLVHFTVEYIGALAHC
jgi:hypothetical protein